MSFILLFLIAFLIIMSFRKYRSAVSVIVTLMVMAGMTTGVLLYGLQVFSITEVWHVFGKDITSDVFIALIAAWYLFDAICGIKIIRNYVEYRRVNTESLKTRNRS